MEKSVTTGSEGRAPPQPCFGVDPMRRCCREAAPAPAPVKDAPPTPGASPRVVVAGSTAGSARASLSSSSPTAAAAQGYAGSACAARRAVGRGGAPRRRPCVLRGKASSAIPCFHGRAPPSEICVARREATLFCVSFGLVPRMRLVVGSAVGAGI